MRQALAGMLWSKQYFGFDVDKWLEEHGVDVMKSGSRQMRNSEWSHMVNEMSSRCRTSGSIRGLPPGIWPSMPSRFPVWMSISRRSNWI